MKQILTFLEKKKSTDQRILTFLEKKNSTDERTLRFLAIITFLKKKNSSDKQILTFLKNNSINEQILNFFWEKIRILLTRKFRHFSEETEINS